VAQRALGGLKPATRRLFQRLVAAACGRRSLKLATVRKLEPGAVLIREWGGIKHRVMVRASGFSFGGKEYRSLFEVAEQDLDRREVTSKVRCSPTGTSSGGKNFSRGARYELLSNPIYIGEIRHKRERHPGQHQPILERELWEQVQQRPSQAGESWQLSKTHYDDSGLSGGTMERPALQRLLEG
jgi:hypothetical protein